MSAFDMDELKDILRKMGGVDEADLDGDIADTEFAFLGYDSLALLETAALIKRQYGVTVSDEDLHGIDTPRSFLEKVNSVLV
jgi:act minimal PKS acyl carrier protein